MQHTNGFFTVKANLVNIKSRTVTPAEVTVQNGAIHSITELDAGTVNLQHFLLPRDIQVELSVATMML